MNYRSYTINAEWGSRQETASACAQRLVNTLLDLADLSPIFAQWNRQGDSRETANDPFCKMAPDIGELTDIVQRAQAVRDATGEPWPELGYNFATWNGRHRRWRVIDDDWGGASRSFRSGADRASLGDTAGPGAAQY